MAECWSFDSPSIPVFLNALHFIIIIVIIIILIIIYCTYAGSIMQQKG